MRDKSRIKPMVDKIEECWKCTPEMTLYELLFNLYHNSEDSWVNFYKEDDYWKNIMDNWVSLYTSVEVMDINSYQKESLNNMKIIWEAFYDLRFPQICYYLYEYISNDFDDENTNKTLEKKVGELYGK